MLGYRQHPVHDTSQLQTFLARQNDRVCGRIAAILNQAHNEAQRESMGFVGFFDAIDNTQAAQALFNTAGHWLASQGATRMRGPVSPTMNYEAGLLVRGHDSPPTFMMPYNAAYYERLWIESGFEKVQDLFAFQGHKDMLGTMNEKVAKLARAAEERFGVTFRKVNRRQFTADVKTFLRIYNEASSATWGFVPLSEKEIIHLAGELKHLIIPELTAIAEVDGRVVGAAFAMLDYNPLIRKINGRLFPFGFVSLLTRRRRLKKARLMSANVVPEFQRWGLALALLRRMLQSSLQWGLAEVEFSYVLESNHLARSSLENGGAICTKTYRIYERDCRSHAS